MGLVFEAFENEAYIHQRDGIGFTGASAGLDELIAP
jgi:hypothetical protein